MFPEKKNNQPTIECSVSFCCLVNLDLDLVLFFVGPVSQMRNETVKSTRVCVSSEMARHAISIGRTVFVVIATVIWRGFGFYFASLFKNKHETKKLLQLLMWSRGYFGALNFNRIKFFACYTLIGNFILFPSSLK